MKKIFASVPAAILLAASLTSCQSGGVTGATDCAPSGSASEAVQVSGEFGSTETELTAGLPVDVQSLERSVLIEGDGADLTSDNSITAQFSVFNGTTGDLLVNFADNIYLNGEYHEVFKESIKCSSVGDRIAAVFPAAELYGEGQVGNNVPGMGEDEGLVVVIDFVEEYEAVEVEILDQAEGKEIPLPGDTVEVEVASNGEPTITIPEGLAAPKELEVHTMVEGEGPVVQDGQTVNVHYRGVIWSTGQEFDSSWSRGMHAEFPVGGVIDGFKNALVGQTVGSRVLSIVPPESGYGADGLQQMGYEADDVMVFVLDILSAQ